MVKDIITMIKGVSETLFFILYARAIESQSKNPIIIDEKSVEIVKILDDIFSKSDSKVHKMLYNRNLSNDYIVLKALRTKKFDEYTHTGSVLLLLISLPGITTSSVQLYRSTIQSVFELLDSKIPYRTTESTSV